MIFLEPNELLYINVIDSIYDGSNESDRYYYIEKTLEEVMEEFDFPMPYRIVRFGHRTPEQVMRMNFYLYKWGRNRFGEIEVRFSVSLRASRRHKNTLGRYYTREQSLTFSVSQERRNYNDVLKKALVEMARDLDARIMHKPGLQKEVPKE